VFKSADSGATWIPVNSGLPRSYSNTQYEHITCLVAAGHAIFAGTAKGSYRLPEDGDVWTGVNDGLVPTGGDPSVACFAVSGVNLFAGTEFGGAFLSTNNGTSWTPLNEGLPRGYEREQCGVLSLAADDTYLYACPGFFAMELGFDCAGLWRRPLSEIITSVHTPPENMARGFWLSQNYPNPFNPSTTIKYELPKASHVSLMVYDILGRKVSELVNEKRDAGVHEVMFEGMNLASGVYFYRLRAGSFVDVKRFILLK
jgi:hypothetical protein